jgi:8-oxo-dGTP diphosphatase
MRVQIPPRALMKFEFSAGGIVFKRGTTQKKETARNNAEEIFILVAQHSQHHGWVFPKGLIGDNHKGETKEETAVREVKEETGVVGKIVKELEPTIYWYRFKNQKIKKTVYYFLMEYISGDIKDHDFEMEKVEWLPIDEVEKRLTYKSDKEVWEKALEILKSKY